MSAEFWHPTPGAVQSEILLHHGLPGVVELLKRLLWDMMLRKYTQKLLLCCFMSCPILVGSAFARTVVTLVYIVTIDYVCVYIYNYIYIYCCISIFAGCLSIFHSLGVARYKFCRRGELPGGAFSVGFHRPGTARS